MQIASIAPKLSAIKAYTSGLRFLFNPKRRLEPVFHMTRNAPILTFQLRKYPLALSEFVGENDRPSVWHRSIETDRLQWAVVVMPSHLETLRGFDPSNV